MSENESFGLVSSTNDEDDDEDDEDDKEVKKRTEMLLEADQRLQADPKVRQRTEGHRIPTEKDQKNTTLFH